MRVSGYSQYAAAAAAASTGVFPHMSSAFSLFPPPSAMFPSSSALPFGGLGSLSDSGLLSTAEPGLDSAAGKSFTASHSSYLDLYYSSRLSDEVMVIRYSVITVVITDASGT